MTAKTCPNGHQMDPSWKVCPYCRSDAPAADRKAGAGDETVREAWPQAPPPPPPPRPPAGLAATVREPARPPAGLAATVREPAPAAPPPAPAAAQRRTVRMALVDVLARGWLVPLAGAQKGETFAFDEAGGTVGAADDNRARLDNEFASGRHFAVRFADGRFHLRDSGSTNGTVVNGSAVAEQPGREVTLMDGDRITIGRTDYAWKELVVDGSSDRDREVTR